MQLATPSLWKRARAEAIARIMSTFRPLGRAVPIVESIPDHFALSWEPDSPVITAGTGTAVISDLRYSGYD